MSDDTKVLHPAEIAKLEAEAKAMDATAALRAAEVRKVSAEAETAEHTAALNLMELESSQRAHRVSEQRVYHFFGQVGSASVGACMGRLNGWRINDPGCDVEIVFNSPGGSVIDGLALYDFIQQMRREGHHVTTSTIGYAASMGGVLLQAGDLRVMGRESVLMIHEIAFGSSGKIGEIEDSVEMGKMLGERLANILAGRSKMTARQLKNKWERKDWWLTSEESLELGFVDEVR